MSTTKLTCASGFQRMFVRHVHQAPDRVYLEKGMANPAFKARFAAASKKMAEYPQFMERYYRVASSMRQKNYVPLVHAQQAALRPVRVFFEALYKPNQSAPFFRYLRHPSPEVCLSREQVMRKMEEKNREDTRPFWDQWGEERMDQNPHMRPHLLSVSYSLADSQRAESAADFLLENQSISPFKAVMDQLSAVVWGHLRRRGKADQHPFVMKRLEDLANQAKQQSLGTLYVIGVPRDLVDRYAYDSLSYGRPTGKLVSDVAGDLSGDARAFQEEDGGLQARLMLYDETLNPASKLEIVDVNDEEEVDRYCRGSEFQSPRSVSVYQPVFVHETTFVEKENRERQQSLDLQAKEVAMTV